MGKKGRKSSFPSPSSSFIFLALVSILTRPKSKIPFLGSSGRDPFNQNSNRSDREKRTTSKGGPVFPKLFRLDRTDALSFGPKCPESLVEWIAPSVFPCSESKRQRLLRMRREEYFLPTWVEISEVWEPLSLLNLVWNMNI